MIDFIIITEKKSKQNFFNVVIEKFEFCYLDVITSIGAFLQKN